MADFRFELDRAGVRELLLSKEMAAVINDKASEVLRRLPNGYGMTSGTTEQRAKAHVGTRSAAAASENKKNNTLLKALGGGG